MMISVINTTHRPLLPPSWHFPRFPFLYPLLLIIILLLQTASPQAQEECPIIVQYDVNLGTQSASSSAPTTTTNPDAVPIFLVQMSIQNNSPSTTTTIPTNGTLVDEWRLGWQFPYGSYINSQDDIFDNRLQLLNPESTTPVVQTADVPLLPGGEYRFTFLGTKNNSGTTSTTTTSNPYNVGAPVGMVFNNMLCRALPVPTDDIAARPGVNTTTTNNNNNNDNNIVSVEYTPIVYINQPIVNSFTQYLVRLRNVLNGTDPIPLSSISLQYWFEGPEEGVLPLAAEFDDPSNYLQADCEWATTGCRTVELGVKRGLRTNGGSGSNAAGGAVNSNSEEIMGARYYVEIKFTDEAGLLLPTGSDAVAPIFIGQGESVMDVLVTITTKANNNNDNNNNNNGGTVGLFNSTQDYSYIDTPILDINNSSSTFANSTTGGSNIITILPRRAVLNERLPAYVDDKLVWGIPPTVDSVYASDTNYDDAAIMNDNRSGGGGGANGDGVQCVTTGNGLQQTCGIATTFCCMPAIPGEVLSATVPAVWPPQPPTNTGGISNSGGNVPVGAGSGNSTTTASPEGGGDGGNNNNNNTTTTTPTTSPDPESSEQLIGLAPLEEGGGGTATGGGGGFVFNSSNLELPGESSSSSSNSEDDDDGGGGSSSSGAIVGIAIGAVAAVGVVFAALAMFLVKKRREQRRELLGTNSLDIAEQGVKHSSSSGGGGGGGGGGSGTNDGDSPGSSSPLFAAITTTTPNNNQRTKQYANAKPDQSSNVLSLLASHHHLYHSKSSPIPGSTPLMPLPMSPSSISNTASSLNLIKFPSGSTTAGFGAGDDNQHDREEAIDEEEEQRAMMLINRKACTAPALFSSAHSSSLGRHSSSIPPSSSLPSALLVLQQHTDDNNTDLSQSSSSLISWLGMARRTQSWDGVINDDNFGSSLDGYNAAVMQVMGRRKTAPPMDDYDNDNDNNADRAHIERMILPPQDIIPPPPYVSSSPSSARGGGSGGGDRYQRGGMRERGVDLNVDWSEIKGNLGHCLGTGGFGAVYEAKWRGKTVAVKKLPPFSDNNQPGGQVMYDALLREIALASKFDCDRLVRVYGACTQDKDHVCLIMELCENGNLASRIYDRRRRRMSYLEILQIAHDVAQGLAYLHPSVIHRDLKPQNILLDLTGRAKLADFGISRIKDPTKSYLSQITSEKFGQGTPFYMSPEQFSGEKRIDEKIDVYALGCILNECWTRRQPWKDSSHFFQIILKVAINGERPWVDPDCPLGLQRLIGKCWHQDPHMRPSCAEISRLSEILIEQELRKWEESKSPKHSNSNSSSKRRS